MRNTTIKQMTYAAILIALAILIPIQFSFLRVNIPPFTATLASHVPMFLSMLISPFVAVVVGIGSAIGFVVAGTPLFVVARAAMHIFVGLLGAYMIKKGVSYAKVIAVTAPIHGLLEAIAVMPFPGFNLKAILITVFIGTILHHAIDGTITYALVEAVSKATGKDFKEKLSA
ncbi:membrane protein [Clostridium polyendosporum]|uniref:Membrane protein n=1 Tax=Clostridium polyendosporum TaxID=69208 RepID=A0A919S0E9_9CLOT|nr:ECF transporter S component [Clostridium polyendosporum]GIM29574.1 membrane protein [Clostridium polyendosporum]